MADLQDFLLARIAEDEDVARAARGEPDHVWELWTSLARNAYGHELGPRGSVEASPARVLAECEAKRYVLRICAEVLKAFDDREGGMWPDVNRRERSHAHAFLAHLALPYAEHEDYLDEWRH